MFGSGSSKTWRIAVVAVVAALLVGSGAAYGIFKLTNPGSQSKSAEVLLQPGADTGPDPYTASVATTRPQVAGTPSPAAGQSGGEIKVASTRGSAPGLYGGTQQEGTCNTDQLVTYLRQNPSKAAAWVQALNSDPGLRWSGGSQVRTEQIDQYAHELTSVLLRTDTRITNHGYRNGSVTTFASVLEAGTAVLVDHYGVPRARCACGNPLTSPTSLTGAIVFVGPRWQTFSSSSLVAISSSTTIIDNFTVVNVHTGVPFARPVGGSGASDTAADPAAVAQLSPGGTPDGTNPPPPGATQPAQSPNPAQSPGHAPTAQPSPPASPPQATAPGTAPTAEPSPTSPAAAPTSPAAPPASPPEASPPPATPLPATSAPPSTPPPTSAPTPPASPTPDFSPFAGTWTSPDGTSLTIQRSGRGAYKPPQGPSVEIELTEATPTAAKGTKDGAPFTVTLQGAKLVTSDGLTLTQS